MKKSIRKGLSVLLAGSLLFSSMALSVSAAEPEAKASPPDSNVIDYSFEQLGGNGWSFGLAGNEYRYQTFTAPEDGAIETVEVVVLKKNAASVDFPDLTAALYDATGGAPTGEPLVSSTMEGINVKSATNGATVTPDMITRFELPYKDMKQGRRYALVLKSSEINADGGKDYCYDWYTSARVNEETFGKLHTDGSVSDESHLGTGWMKLTYKTGPDVPAPVDYTFETSSNGLGFGATGNEYRWQTFTSTASAPMGSIDLKLTKLPENSGESKLEDGIHDLIVELRSVKENKPDQLLTSKVVRAEEIESKGVTNIELPYLLEEGVQYAIALTMKKPMSSHGGYDCYGWPTSSQGTAITGTTEYFGKSNNSSDPNYDGENNWVDESGFYPGWLRVNYTDGLKGEIDYSFSPIPSSGFTMAVADCAHRFQTFTATENTNLNYAGIAILALGDTDKEDEYTHSDIIVKLYATDNDGFPTGDPLSEGTIPYYTFKNAQENKVNLPYVGLEKGKRYAIAITQTVLPPNGDKKYPVYDWPTKNGVAANERFGKLHSDGGVADESFLGTGWLKLYTTTGEPDAPETSKPTVIEATVDKGLLTIGETAQLSSVVRDQFGITIPDVKVTYSTSDTETISIDANGQITALAGGVGNITAVCGDATAMLSVTVIDASGEIVPVPSMVIDREVKLKPGVYDFNGGNGITITASNITVDGTGVTILNADMNQMLADVTTGAYAYRLNPAEGKTAYQMTRRVDLGDVSKVTFSFDAKAANFAGVLKVYASTDNANWEPMATFDAITSDWAKYEADLSKFANGEVYIRLAYEGAASADMNLLVDTLELFEDNVRTFSDLCEAKPFYWWTISYEDGVRVDDGMKAKPFDRTTYSVDINKFSGTGITAKNVENVTIKGFTIGGFYYAMNLTNCYNMKILGNNLSNNYTNPNGGWGDQEGGAMLLTRVSNSTIEDNIATNNANGLQMKYCDNNIIRNNNFSVCSDVCLEMWNASFNTIEDNDFSWGIRIDAYGEEHARDSTSQLMESGSNYNDFLRNDFTHGGDGIFLRVLNGWCCEGNVFEENDTSFANNNAVESWAGRNYYIRNKANYSSYGFWLGGSDESELYYNEAAYNGIMPSNAPEPMRGSGSGHAGIALFRGGHNNIKIVGNSIHHNDGPGIAVQGPGDRLGYGFHYPAHNWLIQNNRITDNMDSKAGQKGYAIWMDDFDWGTINGNLIENNAYDEVKTTDTVTNVIFREGTYEPDLAKYLSEAPTAKMTTNTDRYYVGQEIIFSGADSVDPNQQPLYFRWDMDDGIVLSGETVTYAFDEPGLYAVAFSVFNGKWYDTTWKSINVVAPGGELGTEDDAANWEFTDNKGKTTLSNAVSADGPLSDLVDYYTYFVVDGERSILLDTTASNNTITYPKTKDAGYDLSGMGSLSFSMKVVNEGNSGSITVRLYTDADNYITYTCPSRQLLSMGNFGGYGDNEYRHEWMPINIPFDGNNLWKASKTGNPDLASINYYSIQAQPNGTLKLWIDGMKALPVQTETPYYSSNLSLDGSPIYSASAEADSKPSAPLSEKLSVNNYWVSAQDAAESNYGVEFSAARYINKLNVSYLFNPTSDPLIDTIALPKSYRVQYRAADGTWKDVANAVMENSRVLPGQNEVTFDLVNTDALRVVMQNTLGMSVAIYGFQTYNMKNYAAETDPNGSPKTTVSSSIVVDAVLDSIDMYVCVNDAAQFPEYYGDFEVALYAADGAGPTGPALAKGTITKETIVAQGLNKEYNIPMRTENGGKYTLRSGRQYAVLATQNPRTVDDGTATGNLHYRWKTNSSLGIVGEQFGKVNATDISNITSYAPENLGTGWLRVHTDKDTADKATIDFSWDTSGSSGFGLGHQGEENRYQTFTMPEDSVYNVVDGKVTGESWSTEGAAEAANTIALTFESAKSVTDVNIFFEDGKVPASLEISANGQVLKTVPGSELKAGFNLISFDAVATDQISISVANGDSFVAIQEIEVTGEGQVPAEQEETLLTLTATPDTVSAGASTILTAVLTDRNGNPIQGATVSFDNGIGDKVTDRNGKIAFVTAVSETTTYWASYAGSEAYKASDASVTVTIATAPVNKNSLEKAIAVAKLAQDSDAYQNAVQWAKDQLDAALLFAEQVNKADDATQPQVDKAVDDLMEAVWDLGFISGTLTELQAWVDYADTLDMNHYTNAGKEDFLKALEAAKALLIAENVMQPEIDEALTNLQNAIKNLVPTVDKAELKKQIDKADALQLELYVESGKAELAEALAEAKKVYNNLDATKKQVSDATDKLIECLMALRYKADKELLGSLIEQARDINLDAYTEESIQVLRTALSGALKVLANEALSEDDQSVVDETADMLSKAINGLQKKSDGGAQNPSETPSDPTTTTGDSSRDLFLMAAALLLAAGVLLAARKRRMVP